MHHLINLYQYDCTLSSICVVNSIWVFSLPKSALGWRWKCSRDLGISCGVYLSTAFSTNRLDLSLCLRCMHLPFTLVKYADDSNVNHSLVYRSNRWYSFLSLVRLFLLCNVEGLALRWRLFVRHNRAVVHHEDQSVFFIAICRISSTIKVQYFSHLCLSTFLPCLFRFSLE